MLTRVLRKSLNNIITIYFEKLRAIDSKRLRFSIPYKLNASSCSATGEAHLDYRMYVTNVYFYTRRILMETIRPTCNLIYVFR